MSNKVPSKQQGSRASESETEQPAKRDRFLTRADRVKLMFETMCDERTIRKWEDGVETINATTRDKLERAARKHKIPIPERAP
jgi:hypothetical protein